MPYRRHIASVLALGSLFTTPMTARADVAPPERPPGNTIAPTRPTTVVMSSERVVIDVRLREPDDSTQRGLVDSTSLAAVTAVFTMTNPGASDERMDTRFPLGGENDGFFGYPLVRLFAVDVNGAPVTHTVTSSASEADGRRMWAQFETLYPAGASTVISVSYVLSPTGYYPTASYSYIFATGAGWDGPIGSAELLVRLPYPVSSANIYPEQATHLRWGRPQYRGNEARWLRRRFEPTQADNFRVNVISPDRWLTLTAARRATTARNASAESWRMLGRAYEGVIESKYIIATHSLRFVQLMLDAYRQAVKRDPGSVPARLDTAEALMFCCATMFISKVTDDEIAAATEAAAHLDAVLTADEGNKDAANGLERLNAIVSDWPGLPGAAQSSGLSGLTTRLQELMRKYGLGTKG